MVYTLRYFKVNGRAGGIRLFLDWLGVQFNEEYIAEEDWEEVKQTTPFGKVPVFVVNNDEFVIPETIAIYHYIAAKHGGLPASIEDQVMCDVYGEHLQDYVYRSGLFHDALFQNKPKSQVHQLHDEAVKYLKERIIPDLNKQLMKNGKGFLVGHEYTWVDFMAADIIDAHLYWTDNADKDEIGEVVKHRDRVFALPGLEKRLLERNMLFPPKEMKMF